MIGLRPRRSARRCGLGENNRSGLAERTGFYHWAMPLVLDADAEDTTDRAAQTLADGGLVVIPVGGVYGVVADAFVPEATVRLRSLRQARPDSPLTLLVRTRHQLSAVASSVSPSAERLVAAFWPGPLTLILPAAEMITVDLGATRGTVAVRMPADERATALIAASGPLACSSAAPAGASPPRTVQESVNAWGDAVQAYVDAGSLGGDRSTVVDCSRGGAEVRRRGAISADEIIDAAAGADGWSQAVPATKPDGEPQADSEPAGDDRDTASGTAPWEPTDPGVQE